MAISLWSLNGMLAFADILLATLIFLVLLSRNKRPMNSMPEPMPEILPEPVAYDFVTINAPAVKAKSKPKANKNLRIVGRREASDGSNTHYKLSNKKIVTRANAVKMVKNKKLKGYQIINVKGKEYLRDSPDTREHDNIDNQKLI